MKHSCSRTVMNSSPKNRIFLVLIHTPLCWLAFLLYHPSVHAQTEADYQVLRWLPSSSIIGLMDSATKSQKEIKPAQDVRGGNQLCLLSKKTIQTLIEVKPKEGGEARFVVLGGGNPVCQETDKAWSNAASRVSTPWYRTIFALIGEEPSGARLSASTAGNTRDVGPANYHTPTHSDPCTIFPTADGLILLPGGPTALTLVTSLPESTTLMLTRSDAKDEARIETQVAGGLARWPLHVYKVGEHWRIIFRQPVNSAEITISCNAEVRVQPQSAHPIRMSAENGPGFAADEATIQAALVAGQLDDVNLAAWHAWLLSTLMPTETSYEGIGPSLWRSWWNNHGATLPHPAVGKQ